MTTTSAHLDTFANDRLPAPDRQPEFLFELPTLQFPPRLNCGVALLDDAVRRRGWGARSAVLAPEGPSWRYDELLAQANRIAHVLVREMGLLPGNRVLLRSANSPMLAACWFAVVKAGGIAVATMPLLRAGELAAVIAKAQVSHALCDAALADELDAAVAATKDDAGRPMLTALRHFHTASPAGLEALMAHQPAQFANVDTAATDTVLIAFTSGTTGRPKGTVHNHRDLMAACACWPPHVLKPSADDRFIGSPPLAFTFGLGGLLLFPLSIGASVVLLDKPTPAALLQAIAQHRASVLFTAPTAYRTLAADAGAARLGAPQGGPLRQCVSAGEVLPAATRALWKQHTGIELIDGIGATEMLHIFISADEHDARPGATGRVVPGYRACVLGADGRPLPPGEVGRLAVKGPTGCRYLDDPRQADYVQDGWNITGDAYWQDDEGYFHFHARTDDMIVSAGYNIAAPEVEEALLTHPAVAECAVVGVPDEERGQAVWAFVVLRPGHEPGPAQQRALQDHARQAIAPYKCPRRVEFLAGLPRTETGKLQRFKLKAQAAAA